jgi:hypothetical protein
MKRYEEAETPISDVEHVLSCRRALKGLLGGVAAAALMAAPRPVEAAAIVADGVLDPSYQLGFTIGFVDTAGNAIGDGLLYFGINSADQTQFLYFQMPLHYVDNTYGANAAADWDKGHKFNDLLGSDALGSLDKKGMPFSWNGNEVKIDYLAGVVDPCATQDKKGNCVSGTTSYRSGGLGTVLNDGATDKNDGSVGTLGANNGGLLEIATSLEYDLLHVDSTATTDSSLDPNWIKEVGYELQFAAGTFNASDWLDKDLAYTLISLGSPHVSPSKKDFGDYDTPECIVGCGPNISTSVAPEPGSLLLLGSGLTALRMARRRRAEREGKDPPQHAD